MILDLMLEAARYEGFHVFVWDGTHHWTRHEIAEWRSLGYPVLVLEGSRTN
jgi:hypothetical protein